MASIGSNQDFYQKYLTSEEDKTDLIFKSLSAIKSTDDQEKIKDIVKEILPKFGNNTNKLEKKIETISGRFKIIETDKLSYEDKKLQKLVKNLTPEQKNQISVVIEQFNEDSKLLISKFNELIETGVPEAPNQKITDLSAGKETKSMDGVHPNKTKRINKNVSQSEPQQTMSKDLTIKLNNYYTKYDKVKTMRKMNPQIILTRENLKKLRKECANQMIKERLTPPRKNGVVTEAVEDLIQEMAQLCCDDNKKLGSVEQLGGGTGSAFVIKAGSGKDATNLFVFKPIDLQPGGTKWKRDDDYTKDLVNNYFGGAKGVEVRDYIRATSPFSTHVATIATLPGSQFGLEDEKCKGLLIDFSPNVGSMQDLTAFGLNKKSEDIEKAKEKLDELRLHPYNIDSDEPGQFDEWLEKIPFSENGKKNLILHYFGAVYYHSTDENPGNFLLQKDGEKEFQLSFIDGGQSMPVKGEMEAPVNPSKILKFAGNLIKKQVISEELKNFLTEIKIEELLKSDLGKLQKHGVHEKNSEEILYIRNQCQKAWEDILRYLENPENNSLPGLREWQ